jgi:hypothetical protein
MQVTIFTFDVLGNRPLGRPRTKWDKKNFKFVVSGIQVVDWINLAEDSDKWQVLMNKGFANWGNFWSGDLLNFHEVLRFT